MLLIRAIPPLLILLAAGCGGEETPARPNVILVSIDTLRADHLGCYGYARDTSPFIDALAERSDTVRFARCMAQASTTAPSHMSFLTSLHPAVHGVPNIPPHKGVARMDLPRHTLTLAEVLRRQGYRTAAVVDGGYLEPVFGFEKGFDTYHCAYEGAKAKVDRALEWLEEAREPFFLFLHTYEVHAPYLPPGEFRDQYTGDYDGWIRGFCDELMQGEEKKLDGFSELFKRRDEYTERDVQHLIDLYDGEIAYTDCELERLFASMTETDNLLLILLSDHGEEFGEHGEFSHKNLFDTTLHVPLLFKLPGNRTLARREIMEQVSLIDVMPTLLDLLDIPAPPYLQGESLKPLIESTDPALPRPAFSAFINFGPAPLCRAVRFEEMKLLDYASGEHFELFDLAQDAGEKANLAGDAGKKGVTLFRMLDRQSAENQKLRKQFRAQPAEGAIDPKRLEELRRLGYGY